MTEDINRTEPTLETRISQIELGIEQRVEVWSEWRAGVDDSFEAGRQEFTSLRDAQKELSDKVEENTAITAEIYEIVQMGKRFFKGMERIANGIAAIWRFVFRIVKAVGAIAGAIAAVWAVAYTFMHGGAPPR